MNTLLLEGHGRVKDDFFFFKRLRIILMFIFQGGWPAAAWMRFNDDKLD